MLTLSPLFLGLGFQSSVTPIMEGIVDLHNHIFYFLILVFVFVFWLFGNILYSFWWKLSNPATEAELQDRVAISSLRHVSHSTVLEVVWTIVPSLILIAIAVPSFALLYAMDEIMEPTLTLKVVGHQWYWTYQYSNCISQMHYDCLNHPELVPESLWNRVWSNAAAFYNLYLAVDDSSKLAEFPLKPVPTLVEDWAFEEVCERHSDYAWIDPTSLFSEYYLKFNQLDPEAITIYPRAKMFNLLKEVRPRIPKPVEVGFSMKELIEKGRRQQAGLDILDPERITTQKLYAWLVNRFPDSKKVYKPTRFDLFRVFPYNKANFTWVLSFPAKPTFETLEGRLNNSINSLLPLGYYDIKWFNEYWIRKLIAGKVVEALQMGVNLSGHADRFPGVQFDSYMLNEEELTNVGDYRLLEVDEPVVLPINTHIRLLITADDVIHSFAVPQLGIKVDAVPGRLNQQGVFLKRRGTFYGQCSELCGVNHGFMPIVVKGVGMKEFINWYLHKFDSLYPEYNLKLADKEEVSLFLTKGVYPASFADSFPADRLSVPESLVGDKSNSVFDLPPKTSSATNTMLGFIVDRFVYTNPGLLELNWGLVQLEGASDHSHLSSFQFSPLEGVLSPLPKTVKGPLMDWTNPMIYKQVSTGSPARFLKEVGFVPSRWTLMTMKHLYDASSVEPVPVSLQPPKWVPTTLS